ncbi:MAG: amphi-Trp domain-containing protein [Microbacteriaceae bacterium]|nr:amphi-Trp domain-containing protein [Microbacteriaceae bacterium]
MPQDDAPVFKSKNDITREELADLFQTLADRASEGDLTLTKGTDQVHLVLPDGCRIELEVSDSPRDGGIERELELEITWKVDEQGAPLEGQTPRRGFTIS